MIWSIVGWVLNNRKTTGIVVTALVAILTLYATIQYIQSAERDKITVEIQEETNEKREKIREAVRPNPRSTVADELRYLRDRQSR